MSLNSEKDFAYIFRIEKGISHLKAPSADEAVAKVHSLLVISIYKFAYVRIEDICKIFVSNNRSGKMPFPKMPMPERIVFV